MNRLPGRIGDDGDVQVLGQRLKVLNPNGAERRDRQRAAAPRSSRGRARLGRAGRGHQRSFLGSAVRLDVTLDSGQKVLVELSSHDPGMALGDRASLRILADSVVVEDIAPPEQPPA